jgi:hypothetical protein
MASDRAHFTILLSAKSDLSSATITLRVARLKGIGGTILAYVQGGSPDYILRFGMPIEIDSLGTSMQDVVWKVADTRGSADLTAIERIGIEINGSGGGPYSNPTVIYVDRMDVASSSWTFDAAASVYTTPTVSGPVAQIWLNNHSGDTTVSDASVSWLGP